MRIVIAPDSFKECLAAEQVASAIARGWRRAAPAAQITEVLLADGGEGTTVALTQARMSHRHEVTGTGRLGQLVTARYGLVHDGGMAVVDVADGRGLQCVPAYHPAALAAP